MRALIDHVLGFIWVFVAIPICIIFGVYLTMLILHLGVGIINWDFSSITIDFYINLFSYKTIRTMFLAADFVLFITCIPYWFRK